MAGNFLLNPSSILVLQNIVVRIFAILSPFESCREAFVRLRIPRATALFDFYIGVFM